MLPHHLRTGVRSKEAASFTTGASALAFINIIILMIFTFTFISFKMNQYKHIQIEWNA